jgi:hypothetical protein
MHEVQLNCVDCSAMQTLKSSGQRVENVDLSIKHAKKGRTTTTPL